MSQPPFEYFPPAQPGPEPSRFGGPPAPSAPLGGPPAPSAPTSPFGAPATPYGAVAAPAGTPPGSGRPVADARPGAVSVLAGLLIAQAACAAVPAISLLFARDVIRKILGQVVAGLSGAGGGLPGLGTPSSVDTSRITMWGVLFLLCTVCSALAAMGIASRGVWAFGGAAATEVGVLLWGLVHFGSWGSVSTVAVLLALGIGALLATPDVRRWCLTSG